MYVVASTLAVPVLIAAGMIVGLCLAVAVRAAGNPAGAALRKVEFLFGLRPRVAAWAERYQMGPIASVERSRATGARR